MHLFHVRPRAVSRTKNSDISSTWDVFSTIHWNISREVSPPPFLLRHRIIRWIRFIRVRTNKITAGFFAELAELSKVENALCSKIVFLRTVRENRWILLKSKYSAIDWFFLFHLCKVLGSSTLFFLIAPTKVVFLLRTLQANPTLVK